MNERGAPTPVAWTRLRAPESLMGADGPAAMAGRGRGQPAPGEVRRDGRPRLRPRAAGRPARAGRRQAGRRRRPARSGPRAARSPRPGRARPAPRGGRLPGPTRETSCTTWSPPARSRTSCAPRPGRSRAACSRPAAAEPAQADQRTASSTRSASWCTPRRSRRLSRRLVSACACRVCRRSRCWRSTSARRRARSASSRSRYPLTCVGERVRRWWQTTSGPPGEVVRPQPAGATSPAG